MALQAGHSFGNYRIVQLIGEGGFGEVYLAENPLLERRAAVKVLHTGLASDPTLVKRFLNEARAVSAIRHPNIIEVFDAGLTPEGNPYILMEFLDGFSLQKHLLDRGPMSFQELLPIARQAGSALAAAHAAGIVHRDLKPENIFLTKDSLGHEAIKILDFGIAKIKRSGAVSGTHGTQTGLIMGSPAYMSPEQCKDSADVDFRSDIYSLAVIFYETLTGGTPFAASSGTEMLVMHLTAPVPSIGERAQIPDYASEAIMRALSKDRAQRFDGVSSFIDALTGVKTIQSMAPMATQTGMDMVRASQTEQASAASSVTTFSRTMGELASDEAGTPMPAKRSQRLPVLIGAGVALLGLAVFAFTRLGHAPETSADTTNAAVQPSALPPAPAVVPSLPAPDAGMPLPAANPVAPKLQPSEVVKTGKPKATSPRGRAHRKSAEDDWVVH
jgi:eukaryotic-like serine/threonine-protein kinase